MSDNYVFGGYDLIIEEMEFSQGFSFFVKRGTFTVARMKNIKNRRDAYTRGLAAIKSQMQYDLKRLEEALNNV
jgi:hypothetical protein